MEVECLWDMSLERECPDTSCLEGLYLDISHQDVAQKTKNNKAFHTASFFSVR